MTEWCGIIGRKKADDVSYALQTTASSGLPVHYAVDYGPVAIVNDKVRVGGLPTDPQFPLGCKTTAWQVGRRVGDLVARPIR